MYFEFQQDERPGATWAPVVDVCERPAELVIFVEMPGVQRNDVRILWRDGVLVVSGQKRQQPSEFSVAHYLCVERAYGHFRREIAIDITIDHANARAELKDGLMRIHLPKVSSRHEATSIPIL
jgi:HSP20 family protein